MNIDRLPPHSPEAEQRALGCILLAPNESIARFHEILSPGQEVFYDLRHQEIFKTLEAMHDRGEAIDLTTVYQTLKDGRVDEQVGGYTYLAALVDQTPHALNLGQYLEILREKFLLRRMIQVCTESVSRAYSHQGEALTLLDEFEISALAIRRETERSKSMVDVRETIKALVDDYEAALQRKTPIGILTGFRDIDEVAGGMMPQEMIVIAGLRSAGKTTLALNIASKVARAGIPVGVVSLETSGKKVLHRVLSEWAQVDGSAFLRGKANKGDYGRMVPATTALNQMRDRFLIHDEGMMSPRQLSAVTRRMSQNGAKLFVVDYLQQLNVPGEREYEKVTTASRSCKGLAKELNAPVIVVASLNRESDTAGRKPKLSDLRASGQIEYDADKVFLLSSDSDAAVRQVCVDVAKNKDGGTGKIELTFFAPQFRMADCSKIADEDCPDRNNQTNDP